MHSTEGFVSEFVSYMSEAMEARDWDCIPKVLLNGKGTLGNSWHIDGRLREHLGTQKTQTKVSSRDLPLSTLPTLPNVTSTYYPLEEFDSLNSPPPSKPPLSLSS